MGPGQVAGSGGDPERQDSAYRNPAAFLERRQNPSYWHRGNTPSGGAGEFRALHKPVGNVTAGPPRSSLWFSRDLGVSHGVLGN